MSGPYLRSQFDEFLKRKLESGFNNHLPEPINFQSKRGCFLAALFNWWKTAFLEKWKAFLTL